MERRGSLMHPQQRADVRWRPNRMVHGFRPRADGRDRQLTGSSEFQFDGDAMQEIR